VVGNRLLSFMSAATLGNQTPNNGVFLFVDSYDGSTTQTTTRGLLIADNDLGSDQLCPSGLFFATGRFRFKDVRFLRNRVEQLLTNTAIVTYENSIIDLGTLPNDATTHFLDISENYFRMVTPGGVYTDTLYITVTDGGASCILQAIKLVDNTFVMSNGTVDVPNIFLAVDECYDLRVEGNMGRHDGFDSVVISIDAPTTVGTADPVLPGSGNSFSDNINVRQA
jgi:hypothetical protein